MQYVFLALAFASLLGIVLGLIKPALVLRWGTKRTRFRAVAWYLLFTLVFLVATGLTGQKGQNLGPSQQAKQEIAPAVAPQQPEKLQKAPEDTQPYKVGMDIPVGKFVYNVKSVKFAKRVGNSMAGKTADGVFLVVGMTVLNNDTEARTLDGSLFKIKDATGTEFEHSNAGQTALMMSGVETIFLKQCQPKIPTSGILVFEVPDKNSPYTLELSGGYWSGKRAQVPLQ